MEPVKAVMVPVPVKASLEYGPASIITCGTSCVPVATPSLATVTTREKEMGLVSAHPVPPSASHCEGTIGSTSPTVTVTASHPTAGAKHDDASPVNIFMLAG